MSPIKKCTTRRPNIHEIDGPAPVYVANVLRNKRLALATNQPQHLGYGSDEIDVDQFINEEAPMRGLQT